jgi:mono/diheme cytochrome c family protein
MVNLAMRKFFAWLTPLVGLVFALCCAAAVAGHRDPTPAECPQPRFTGKAPDELYSRVNPLAASRGNRNTGSKLYHQLSDPGCSVCHGDKGEGNGQLAEQFDPRPRNFACAVTIDGIPDGQLHWIIKNGSPGTAMPPFGYLSDEEIWQLVIYLRYLSGH